MIAQMLPTTPKRPTSQQNSLLAPITTLRVPIREGVNIIVLNHFQSTRVDVWLVFEEFEGLQDYRDSVVLSLVTSDIHYDSAVAKAEKYVRAVYGKEIAAHDLPF